MKQSGAKGHLTRRHIWLAAVASPLSGCDSAPYGVKMSDWGHALGVVTGIESAPAISREQAAQIPYATIGFRIGDSPESLLILANISQTTSLWTSSQRQAIVTRNGRISETEGFRWNLRSTNFVEVDPVGTKRLGTPLSSAFDRICDFSDINLFQVPIASVFEIQAPETITILDADLKTTRVAEKCRCETLNWDFENYYWIDDQSGYVWKSIQTTHPNQQPFMIEVLRPEK